MNNSPPGTYHFGPIQMRESKMRVAAVTIFQAGAQNLLMTLWPISDQTTVQIMLDFYDAAEKTDNAPQALAAVQRGWLVKLRKEKDWRARSDWPAPSSCRHKENSNHINTHSNMYPSHKSNSEPCASQHASSRWRFALIFAVVIVTIIIAAPNGLAQQSVRPLKVRALRSPGGRVSFVEYSGFSTTGRIFELSPSSIGVMTDKACWAPFGRGQAALWPPGMVLNVSVAAVGVPVAIDGKKAALDQLAVGQSINVTYSIYSGGYCAARRINASSSPAGRR